VAESLAPHASLASKRPRRSRRFVTPLATSLALVGVGLVSSTFATACYDRSCEGDFVVYGDRPGEGRMVDENTWESSAVDGVWIDYRASRTIAFLMPAFFDRMPTSFEAYISPVAEPLADPQPGSAPDNFSIASGNLAEFIDARPGGVNVLNATCASYFIRVVVRFAPVVPPPLVPDAGDAGDAEGGSDAGDASSALDATLGSDAPLDAPTEADADGALDATADVSGEAG
jgi:hypothetical protein